MVIIRTSAMEVSIQAVSPEVGEQLSNILASHAGTGGSGAVGAGVASSAYDVWEKVEKLRKIPRRNPNTRATSPARECFLNIIVQLLSLDGVGAGFRVPRRRFLRCGCARHCRGQE